MTTALMILTFIVALSSPTVRGNSASIHAAWSIAWAVVTLGLVVAVLVSSGAL